MANGRLTVHTLRCEEGFLAQHVAASHDVAHALLIRVMNRHHERAEKDEVNGVHLVTLLKQRFTLAHPYNLRIVDDELVCVEADLCQDFVVQPDLLQTQHLLLRLVTRGRGLELIDKVLHAVLAGGHIFFLPFEGLILLLATSLILRALIAVSVEAQDVADCV